MQLNLAGLHGRTIERTIRPGRENAGEIEAGRLVGGFGRGEFTIALVAVKPHGNIEKWELDGSVRLSSMATIEREGFDPNAKIATHDKLEQHARDVVDHCRNRYERRAMHYAVVCWDEGSGADQALRWGMAASYPPGPGKWETASQVMSALFEEIFGGES